MCPIFFRLIKFRKNYLKLVYLSRIFVDLHGKLILYLLNNLWINPPKADKALTARPARPGATHLTVVGIDEGT